jgi:hypothetical protein
MSPEPRKDVVYFLVEEDHDGEPTGFVKVGTSCRIHARLSALQGGNPRPLRVAKSIEGYESVEAQIHRLIWPEWHVQGEWYRFPSYALAAIENKEVDSVDGFIFALFAYARGEGLTPRDELPWFTRRKAAA